MLEGLRQLEDFYSPNYPQVDVPVESARQAHKSATVANRTIQAMQPASPRVPSSSSWWSALKFRISAIGSFFVRVARCLMLTAAEQADQGRALKNDIRSLLKSDDSSITHACKISDTCEKAASYGIDLDSLISNVLSGMSQNAIGNLKRTCAMLPELNWLATKISKTNHPQFRRKIQEHLSCGVAKSSLMLANGIDMQDERQARLWAELDAVYVKAGELDANIFEVIQSVFFQIEDPRLMLPLMQYNFMKGRKDSLVADLLSDAIPREFWLKYSKSTLIAMNNHELHVIGRLSHHPDLSNLREPYEGEKSRREKIVQGSVLALEYRTKLEALANGSIAQCDGAGTNLLTPTEKTSILAKVLSDADAKLVVKVSKLESVSNESDKEIINAAKLEIAAPPVLSLADEKLIDYLDLPLAVPAKILIKNELQDRAELANRNAVYALNNVLHQNVEPERYSFRNLVLGVVVAFEHVNRAQNLQKKIEKPISNPLWADALKGVKPENIIEGLKCLAFLSEELKKINSNPVAKGTLLCVDSILKELDNNQDLGTPKLNDQIAIQEMLELCFPVYSGELTDSELPQLSTKATNAYFDIQEKSALLPLLSRKYRDEETTLSVCPQLVTDMRTPVIILSGKPFDGFSSMTRPQRAELLEKELRRLGQDATDEQIHGVSILLSQEPANTMAEVVKHECPFPLTDEEKAKLELEDNAPSSGGIAPMNPGKIHIVERETNGYFKVTVIFAEDKCEHGFVGSNPVGMNPEKSKYKANVVHLISPNGKILPGGPLRGVFKREIIV